MLEDGGQKEPEAARKAESPMESDFTKKLLADIEKKNAEILKLSTDNMSLKYAIGEKDVEIKKLRAQAEGLNGQVESLKGQVISLNQQLEDMGKFVNEAKLRLGEMDADRAKLAARSEKKEAEEAPPREEDVASIFKRIATNGEPSNGEGDIQKRLKTAKLYDL
jgi:TolA-binding protein